jgi:hypothetical protein
MALSSFPPIAVAEMRNRPRNCLPRPLASTLRHIAPHSHLTQATPGHSVRELAKRGSHTELNEERSCFAEFARTPLGARGRRTSLEAAQRAEIPDADALEV